MKIGKFEIEPMVALYALGIIALILISIFGQ